MVLQPSFPHSHNPTAYISPRQWQHTGDDFLSGQHHPWCFARRRADLDPFHGSFFLGLRLPITEPAASAVGRRGENSFLRSTPRQLNSLFGLQKWTDAPPLVPAWCPASPATVLI